MDSYAFNGDNDAQRELTSADLAFALQQETVRKARAERHLLEQERVARDRRLDQELGERRMLLALLVVLSLVAVACALAGLRDGSIAAGTASGVSALLNAVRAGEGSRGPPST